MGIIINDFEVVVDPPQEEPASPSPTTEVVEPPEPPRTPLEIHDIIERQRARLARLRAH